LRARFTPERLSKEEQPYRARELREVFPQPCLIGRPNQRHLGFPLAFEVVIPINLNPTSIRNPQYLIPNP
jgi:hypothetical protein